jgi:hypothetical protein
MNSLWHKTSLIAGVGWRLVLKELRQNIIVFISPLIFFIPIIILSLLRGKPILLSDKISIVGLIIAFVYAIIFGLQGFAGETDRKTIDFLLSRPISPVLLTGVKFSINIGIYLIWLVAITKRITFDWSLLHLPEGVNGNGVGLIFPIIMSMGFFAGLIARGAERLVITVGMAGLMAGGCYILWNQAFLLMAANYYWFDIPPHIIALVSRWLPGFLLILSLATPLVFSLWFLRGRYSFYRFKPLRRLISVWAGLALVIGLAVVFLGPAVWPLLKNPHGGDWHPRSGVAIAGTYFKDNYPSTYLYIARIGGKPRAVYHGLQIHSARWSPDGKSIAFVDGPWIKVWQRSGVQTIVKGSFPYWSHDGKSLAFVQRPDNLKQFKGVYVVNLENRSVKLLAPSPKLQVLGLAWDSLRHRLYLLHEQKLHGYLEIIDLKASKHTTIEVSTPPPAFFLQSPIITIGPEGKLLLATTYEHQTHVFALIPGQKEFFSLDDSESQGIDMLSQAILCPTGTGYLIPRIEGAYDYKGFIPPHDHHHHDHHEESHQSPDHEHHH